MSGIRLASLAALSSLSLCVACQTALAAPGGAGPSPRCAGLLPPATRPIEVQPASEEKDTLAYLLVELGASTGTVFAVNPVVGNLLRSQRTGLMTDTSIQPSEAWSLCEALLFHNGFRLSVTTARPPHVLGVVPVLPIAGQATPWRSMPIEPGADLALLEEHPALLVTLTIDLPHTDVRQISNSLRGLMDPMSAQQTFFPIGNSNSAVLSGTGTQVLDLVRMLRQVDESARAQLERFAPPAGTTAEVKPPGSSGS